MEVWVTGLGCVCACGRTLAETWAALRAPSPRPPAPPSKLLNFTAGLDLGELVYPAFTVDDDCFPEGFRHSARDTFDLAALAAAEALESAGLSAAELASGRTGVVIGSTAGNALHFLEDYAALRQKQPTKGEGFSDFFNCNPALALAERWNLSGTAMTIGNACCSGTDAVGLALELIRSGRCDRVLAGGADALSLVPYIGFRRLMIYSAEPCRPFDRERGGLNLGEGAGLLLLESAAAAEKRKARPLAALLGYGAASDAHHQTAPHPEARGLRAAIRQALARSGRAAGDMAFINAHGTATPENDRVEALAVREELPGVPLWAVKGSTGHTLGAAGGIEAVLSVMALHTGALPSTHGFAHEDPELKLKPAAASATLKGDAAVSLSLGFGGCNAAAVFGRLS